MKKREILVSFIIPLLFLFLIGFASASISISKVNDKYNFGDKISVTVILSPNSVDGNFEINIICDNESLNIYRVPAEASFTIGREQKVNTYEILTKENIGTLSGNCFISASIGNEKTESNSFEITNFIDIKASLDKTNYNPGEKINLKVEAVKANGKNLDGFLEISGPISYNKAVEKGIANYVFNMADNSESKEYTITLYVYERGKDLEKINEGTTTLKYKINQIPTSIRTTYITTEALPGAKFNFSSQLYDQAGNPIQSKINIVIKSSGKEEISLGVNSGEAKSIELATNATAGKWIITASNNLITNSREFNVAAVPKIEFEFIDSILVIRNIGNTEYNGTVDVKIGDNIEKVNVMLNLAEEKRYNINAPIGDYLVEVSSAESSIAKTLPLTGNAISISEVRGSLYNNRYLLVMIFLIIIISACVIVIYRNLKRKQFDIMRFMPKMPEKRRYEQFHTSRGEKISYLESTGATSRKAVNSPIISGEKMHSSLISLNLKNLSALPESAHTELDSVLEYVKSRKGMIDQKNGDITIIFSPLVTKTHGNEILALKTAFEIFKKLTSYNKKSQKRIEFTLGVNAGEIIANITGGSLQYTGAKTLLTTKRISEIDQNKLLISENIKNKAGRELKTIRVGDVSGLNAYVVSDLTEKQDHSDRIAHIVKRMNE